MKILKPNEEGYGYIIEHGSGYITPELTCKDGVCSNKNLIREFKSGTNLGTNGELPETVEIYAVLQKWGVENKNGRVYPKEILIREAKRYQEMIDMGTSLGELNHPESSIIDADRVSHRITEIWWEGKTLMGKLELDITPGYRKMGIISSVGDKVLNMIRKGWTIGISSRGVGSLKNEGGKNVVQEDFELICWDLVTSPSTPGSWVSSNSQDLTTYTESTEYKMGVIMEEVKTLKSNQEQLLNTLKNFLH